MTHDRLIPWYFVAFFAVITVILTGMVIIAFRAQTGVVAKNPYEQGLAYNKIIEAEEAQSGLGWKGEIVFKQESQQGGNLVFSLKDKSGKIILPDEVLANITRPIDDKMDFKIIMSRNAANIFSADIKFPANGLWEIRLYAKNGNDTYQIAKRVVLE
jgi:nitrogen fixation protein FixH